MKNIVKMLLFLIIVVAGSVWYLLWRKEGVLETKDNAALIDLGDKNRSLFIRAKVWGVAGNNVEIVLSKSNSKLTDKAEDYVFFTSEIFYKVGKDTVILYAPESSISEPDAKIQPVRVNNLKTADEIRDYKINYKKYGLERISVYR
ncbi:hypothetical protein [Pedobacter sp. BMA]|uniref:hypothetical protein n=1 Tax=Pedobacter sp. BMA TaxID=1663685 RepID=UPI000A8E43EB|nr:hypothetical protein [Pedobacter sp. BMA]